MSNLECLLTNLENDFNQLIQKHQDLIKGEFTKSQNQISKLKSTIKEKDHEMIEMNEKLDKANFEEENYQNFSIVSNLSKQITEKEIEIKKYQAQLRIASKTIQELQVRIESASEKGDSVVEESEPEPEQEPEPEPEPEPVAEPKLVEEKQKGPKTEPKPKKEPEPEKEPEPKKEPGPDEEEIEINLTKRKIKGVYYYVSDEDPPLIYECLEDDEVGENPIGEKKGRKSIFYDQEKTEEKN